MALLLELRMALGLTPLCMVVRSCFSLSSQNKLGVRKVTIFGFTSSGSSIHCNKGPQPFGAMPNKTSGKTLRYQCMPFFNYLDPTVNFLFQSAPPTI
jgi:hypothetical protein